MIDLKQQVDQCQPELDNKATQVAETKKQYDMYPDPTEIIWWASTLSKSMGEPDTCV